jgi:hypothetical protein
MCEEKMENHETSDKKACFEAQIRTSDLWNTKCQKRDLATVQNVVVVFNFMTNDASLPLDSEFWRSSLSR